MGRLFWRSFFSYWAAMLVAIVGVGTTIWILQLAEHGRDPSVEAGPRAAVVVAAASQTLSHGGLSALTDLLEDQQRSDEVTPLAVNEAGDDVLGRPVPRLALERALRLLDDSSSSGLKRRVVQRVPLEGGGSLLLFIPIEPGPWYRGPVLHRRPPSPLVPLATGMLASLILGALLAWYAARPIRLLREAFAAVSMGRLDTRVTPLMGRRRDELADLGREFDGMTQKLQTLISAQRSLLHEVSHELRSPLARLQAAIGLARQSPQRTEVSLERIEQEAERVDELVGELLTLSRLEAGVTDSSHADAEPTDLVDLVASIAADAGFEARATGCDVAFSSTGEAIAKVRVELLHRAIENVVRNAVKFTLPGTTVEVEALVIRRETDAKLLLRVADRGPGLDEDELEAVFEPFYRGRAGSTGPGFGLGLAIARRAIEAHGGAIQALNRDSGGLVIEIHLPVGRLPTRPL